jgi:hypothetical protein
MMVSKKIVEDAEAIRISEGGGVVNEMARSRSRFFNGKFQKRIKIHSEGGML